MPGVRGLRPINQAAEINAVDIFTYLLSINADVYLKNELGDNLAMQLIKLRSYELFIKLLKSVNFKKEALIDPNSEHDTALSLLVTHNKIEALKEAFTRGANFYYLHTGNNTLLHLAIAAEAT